MAGPTFLPFLLQSGHVGRLLRYSGVSVFNVVMGYLLLGVFYKGFGWPGWLANTLAVILGSIPAFFLNKRFVWGQSGTTRFKAELLPFFLMNGVGLVASTAAVHAADVIWGTSAAVIAASLAAWGTLWVVKYVLLDRVLFNHPDEPAEVAGKQTVHS